MTVKEQRLSSAARINITLKARPCVKSKTAMGIRRRCEAREKLLRRRRLLDARERAERERRRREEELLCWSYTLIRA